MPQLRPRPPLQSLLGPSVLVERLLALGFHVAHLIGDLPPDLGTRTQGRPRGGARVCVGSLDPWPAAVCVAGGLALSLWCLILCERHVPNAVTLGGAFGGLAAAWRPEMAVLLLAPLPILIASGHMRRYFIGANLGLVPPSSGPHGWLELVYQISTIRFVADFQTELQGSSPFGLGSAGTRPPVGNRSTVEGLPRKEPITVGHAQSPVDPARTERPTDRLGSRRLFGLCDLASSRCLSRKLQPPGAQHGIFTRSLENVCCNPADLRRNASASRARGDLDRDACRAPPQVRHEPGRADRFIPVAPDRAAEVQRFAFPSLHRLVRTGQESLSALRTCPFPHSATWASTTSATIRHDFYFMYLAPGLSERAHSRLGDDIRSADALVLSEVSTHDRRDLFPRIPVGSSVVNDIVKQNFVEVGRYGEFSLMVRDPGLDLGDRLAYAALRL